MEWNAAIFTGLGSIVTLIVGKFVVPILIRMVTNVGESAKVQGDILKSAQEERDRAFRLLNELTEKYDRLLGEWVSMKSEFALVTYQLEQANDTIASLRDEVRALREKQT